MGRTVTAAQTPYARGLSDGFFAWLTGDVGRGLLDSFVDHGLDVRLRDDYLNAYRAGCSVARVEWRTRRKCPVLFVHRKFLIDAPLMAEHGPDDYPAFDLTANGCDAYRRSLPEVLRAVEDHLGEEGRWEQRCVENNLEGTPLVVIDRQIVNGRPAVELDMLALATDSSEPTLVAVELKRDLDNRIQHVAEQALKYVRMLDPSGEGLRADIASSYRTVCGQLRALGFKTCDPSLIRPGMRVVGLVALANYNPRSQLLGRALRAASQLDRPIRFCHLTVERPTLPPQTEWFSAI